MTTIAESARIIQSGKVKSVKALVAAVPITCSGDGCTNTVGKQGNFCSVPCAYPPAHESPCADKACIDLECQVRKGLHEHAMWNIAQQDRKVWVEYANEVLTRLLANSEYGHEGPDFFLEASIEAVANTKYLDEIHVQKPKAVLTTTTKAVRTPRTAKHQPRITDNQEHPVTEKITMTKDEMERAITRAVDARIAEREAVIRSITPVAPADKPVEIVTKKGGRAKIARATAADREFAGLTMPAIVVNEALTIPALEIGNESIDTLVTPKIRSPYNKARYRLDKEPTPLDNETTTYRLLMAEHTRIAALVSAKPVAKTKTAKAAPVAIAVVVDTDAKAVRKAKVKALMTIMGISKDEAKALVG